MGRKNHRMLPVGNHRPSLSVLRTIGLLCRVYGFPCLFDSKCLPGREPRHMKGADVRG